MQLRTENTGVVAQLMACAKRGVSLSVGMVAKIFILTIKQLMKGSAPGQMLSMMLL